MKALSSWWICVFPYLFSINAELTLRVRASESLKINRWPVGFIGFNLFPPKIGEDATIFCGMFQAPIRSHCARLHASDTKEWPEGVGTNFSNGKIPWGSQGVYFGPHIFFGTCLSKFFMFNIRIEWNIWTGHDVWLVISVWRTQGECLIAWQFQIYFGRWIMLSDLDDWKIMKHQNHKIGGLVSLSGVSFI